MHPDERLALATAASVDRYDTLRLEHSERTARLAAEQYLRRKVPGTGANAAAIVLAEALAIRATHRITFNRLGDLHK